MISGQVNIRLLFSKSDFNFLKENETSKIIWQPSPHGSIEKESFTLCIQIIIQYNSLVVVLGIV